MVNYPSDWNNDIIDNIADVNTGIRDTQDRVRNGRYPFFIRSSEVQKLDEFDYDCEAVLTVGDGQIGKIFHYVNGKFSAHQRVYVISNFKKITGKYFFYTFSRFFYNEVMAQSAKTTVDSVRKPMITKMDLYYPNNEKEQKNIVGVLDSFDKHIENLSKLIEKKKMIRDGTLEDLMSGKNRIKGFSDEWKTYKFKDYFKKIPNNTFSRDDLDDRGRVGNVHYGDILIRYGAVLDSKDYIPRLKNIEWYSELRALKEGDVIIADTAEDETVGKVVQIGRMNFPLVSGLHTVACRPKCESAYGFLGYYMNSNLFHKQLIPYITGIKVSSISKKSLDELELLIPTDMEEQKAIASILSSMDKEIENLKKEKEKYLQLKSGAMDDLLTGKVRLV